MNRYRRHPLSAGRIVEGLAFVVTADNNRLHTLNTTGTELWALAAGAGVTPEEAARALVEKFEVDLEVAMEDAEECLRSFVERGILALDE